MTPFSKWKTIGYAAAIFVAGAISGGALGVYETKAHQFVPLRQHEMALRLQHRLQERLALTPDQVAKINPIIESAATDIRSVRMETAQRIDKVFDDTYAKVSALLTPDQRVELDKMQRERREMLQRTQGRGPDGHWHPGSGGSQSDSPVPSPSAS